MINKIKIEIIKNSLEKTEREIFVSLCKLNPQLSLKENKDKAIKLAQLPIVKKHHIGKIYKNEALRYALLSDSELETLNTGMSIVEEFYCWQTIIEQNNYKVLCSPELMEDFLTDCENKRSVEKVIPILKKELKHLECELAKKSLVKPVVSGSSEILIENLNDSQKESLTLLGLKYTNNDNITLSKLKKLYYNKIYGVNSYTKDNLDELSSAFFNVRKAFNIPEVS